MNLAQYKAELREIRDKAGKLLDRLEADEGKLDATPIFMSISEYAKHAQVSEKTVSGWLKQGLPHRRIGKVVRVKVADADNWNVEDATRRSAEMDAHGAKR
ncbi:MAG: Helix-turn-helix domain [Gaiellaceae bacterium]|jgi:hypothetical protein|nr:Helix-turn-helix domain [Gaiellaceae bacterium]